MIQERKRINSFNSTILALYVFQYSLLIPLMNFINGTLLVGISSALLLISQILYNRKIIINIYNGLFFFILFLVLIIKFFYDGSQILVIEYFCMISIVSLIIISFPFDEKKFLDIGFKLAIINFALIFSNPFIGKYEYMRFGYGMVLTSMFVFIKLLYLKGFKNNCTRVLSIIILIISLFEIILYGARGSIFVLVLFFVVDFLFIHKQKIIRNFSILVFLTFVYYNLVSILSYLQLLSNKFGIYSYSLMKFQKQIEEGVEAASSGRANLYVEALEKIKLHPIFGNPINVSEESGMYVHNLFLQVGQDLGVWAIFLVAFLIIISFYLLQKNSIELEKKEILAILFAIAIGRLMFSSILWRRPEFWLLVSYVFILFLDFRKTKLIIKD